MYVYYLFPNDELWDFLNRMESNFADANTSFKRGDYVALQL